MKPKEHKSTAKKQLGASIQYNVRTKREMKMPYRRAPARPGGARPRPGLHPVVSVGAYNQTTNDHKYSTLNNSHEPN